jgi:hypothetical protein
MYASGRLLGADDAVAGCGFVHLSTLRIAMSTLGIIEQWLCMCLLRVTVCCCLGKKANTSRAVASSSRCSMEINEFFSCTFLVTVKKDMLSVLSTDGQQVNSKLWVGPRTHLGPGF